jgi:bacterioferritin-associated ferredoxin
MSRLKDIERAEKGILFRNGEMIVASDHRHGEAKALPKVKPAAPLMLRCGKCKNFVSESLIENHINTCQGGKAECGKCHQWISAAEFVKHFKACPGKKEELARRRFRETP